MLTVEHYLQESAGANGHMQAGPATQAREFPPGLELPSGWIDCPPMGHRITPLKLVPIKVSLAACQQRLSASKSLPGILNDGSFEMPCRCRWG